MPKMVTPSVYLTGYTQIDMEGLTAYLRDTGNQDFLYQISQARSTGISDGEILCSFYAKLCYASLTLGKNENVTRIRSIQDNLLGCLSSGHGSVLEHAQINFVVTNCSRVFTHELVRHRVGTAFSQTSGRYVRGNEIDLVFDPILDPVRLEMQALLHLIEDRYKEMVKKMGLDEMKDFDKKKKATSALRRILPNGQSNEIGFSCNIRTLRHTIQLRTSRHAEWEIRVVFDKIYEILVKKFPLLFSDAKVSVVDGLTEVRGMCIQPYERVEE